MICEGCGTKYRVWNKHMKDLCGECLKKKKAEERRKRKRDKMAEFRATDAVKERRLVVYTVHGAIIAVNQEARKRNLSYGKYTALQREGLI